MVNVYRVMVAESSSLRIIDIAPAEETSHMIMLKIRQREYPELELKTDGLYLSDSGNKITFHGESLLDRSKVEYPKEVLEKYENQILKTYKQMIQDGRERTINSEADLANILDFNNISRNVPQSATMARLAKQSQYNEDLEKRKADLLASRHEKDEKRERIPSWMRDYYGR